MPLSSKSAQRQQQQSVWPLSHPPSPSLNSSLSTPLPRRSNKKPPSLVVYPPHTPSSSSSASRYHYSQHPQPTATTSTSMTASAYKKKRMKNHRLENQSSPTATRTTGTIVPPLDGLFLVSPPPTATRLPNSDALRQARLHQTFDFVSGGSSSTKGVGGEYDYTSATVSKFQVDYSKRRKQPPFLLPSHRVGFAEYGDLEHGYPTVVIGGHGCSRLVGIMFEELAQRHGLRMIWPERPGYGLSEECNPQKLNALDWAEVVIQLMDHLGIQKFSIIAQSVGTVFAMALTHQYSSRISGTMYMISPWVSTKQANTFKWTRRLPASLVTKTLSFAMDVMWIFSKSADSPEPLAQSVTTNEDTSTIACPIASTPPFSPSSPRNAPSFTNSTSANTTFREDKRQDEENAFLASLEGEDTMDLPTDFPPHRPLRHMVRPRHVSLYVAMNKYRMMEPYQSGQLGDVIVALEKYHDFGFSYDGQAQQVAVSAVWGDKDSLIPQRAIDCFANQIRDIRLKILEGEGHDLIWKEGVMAWAIRSIGERWRAAEKQ